ncbi:MAG: histidine kinase [Ferruginibacter sp.]
MTNALDIKKVKFYVWIGLAYATLWMIGNQSNFPGTFLQSVGNNLWRVAYLVVVNFIFFEYSIPFVIRKRRYLIYNILLGFVMLWGHCIAWAYGMYAWRQLGIELHVYAGLVTFASKAKALSSQMGYSVGSVFFFGICRHIYLYIKLKQATQQLRIEKQAAELNYLRSQTNPHFLFNTLNNIYSLARDKSDLAPESILRLSKILRFMLYETSGAYIAVEQELKIINDYIALEKLRYDESLRVNFNYDIEEMKQALPPLLMIPLVENAFKHGVSETRNQPYVDVHLSIKNRHLVFIVKNSAEVSPGEPSTKDNIGLTNLRRQLELLFTDFNLSVQPGQSEFTATLKINLSSHV